METLGRVFTAPEVLVSYLEHVYSLAQDFQLRIRLAKFEDDRRKPHIVKADSRDHVFWRLAPETDYCVDIRQESYGVALTLCLTSNSLRFIPPLLTAHL